MKTEKEIDQAIKDLKQYLIAGGEGLQLHEIQHLRSVIDGLFWAKDGIHHRVNPFVERAARMRTGVIVRGNS